MKTAMNTCNLHGLRVFVLVGLLACGVATKVEAQRSTELTGSELIAQAERMGKQTFKRKSGEVLTFQQIEDLPGNDRATVLHEEMSRAESKLFFKYERINSDASLAKVEADLAKIKADNEALDRNLAKINAEGVQLTEQIADRMRTFVAIGKKLPPETKAGIERDLKTQYIIDGLKPETLSFLKSVLARPELFRDK